MGIKTEQRKERSELFSKTRQIWSNGSSEYLCIPSAAAEILGLEKGDDVVIHDLDDGSFELFASEATPARMSGLIVGKGRRVQGREDHASLFCNVPKEFDDFDAGDEVSVLVFPDRMRIKPTES